MIRSITLAGLLIILVSFQTDSFKDEQLRYPRVRQAYAEKEEAVLSLLQENQLDIEKLRLYIRAYKKEKEIEVWAKNISDEDYFHLKSYPVCRTSGRLGPKRKQGDLQIPEGFYHINRFNPSSNFYLSLGINYPNKSDMILGVEGKLGGDIFIHGACVTIGCLPITDNYIKELYLFCVEARNSGQTNIPVTIFPARLSDSEYNRLIKKHSTHTDMIDLWSDLKRGFDIFNETKQLPSVEILNSGRYKVN